MQLFVISLILAFFYTQSSSLGIFMNLILICYGIGVQVFNVYVNNISPFVFNDMGNWSKSVMALNYSYRYAMSYYLFFTIHCKGHNLHLHYYIITKFRNAAEKLAPYFMIFFAVYLKKNGFKVNKVNP